MIKKDQPLGQRKGKSVTQGVQLVQSTLGKSQVLLSIVFTVHPRLSTLETLLLSLYNTVSHQLEHTLCNLNQSLHQVYYLPLLW